MEPPQPYVIVEQEQPVELLIQPMEPPQPSIQDENRTPDSLPNVQSMGSRRGHRRSNMSIRSGGQPATTKSTPPSTARAGCSDRSVTRGGGRGIRAGLSNLTEMVLNVSAQHEKMKKGETSRAPKRAKPSVRVGSVDLYNWGRQLTAPYWKQPVVSQVSQTPYAAYAPYQRPSGFKTSGFYSSETWTTC